MIRKAGRNGASINVATTCLRQEIPEFAHFHEIMRAGRCPVVRIGDRGAKHQWSQDIAFERDREARQQTATNDFEQGAENEIRLSQNGSGR